MAIATHTISVNAAFLQEIKDDHHELRQLMHHTAAMFNRSPHLVAENDRLVELLTKLRDQLAMHFSLEEAFGYFEDAIVDAPHLSRRATQLRDQHKGLYAQLCELTDRAERLLYHEKGGLAEHLATDYCRFADDFRRHETSESDLVLEAFNDDIGAGD